MKRKGKFNYVEPKVIMTVVVVLIMLVLCIYIMGTIDNVQTQVGISPKYSDTFDVANPDVAQSCGTGQSGLTGITVRQWNGVSWQTVSSAFWAYSGTTVTVQPGGMD